MMRCRKMRRLLLGAAGCSTVLASAQWQGGNLAAGAVEQGWGKLRYNSSVDGNPLTIAGVKYDSGLGSHAPGGFTLKLFREATRLSGGVGIDDEVGTAGNGAQVLLVGVVDGAEKELWNSGLMRAGEPARMFDVDLAGLDQIHFKMLDNGNRDFDHVDFVNLKIDYENRPPRPVFPAGTIVTDNICWLLRAEPGKPLTQCGFGSFKTMTESFSALLQYPVRGEAGFLLDESIRVIQGDGSHNIALVLDRMEETMSAPGIRESRFFLVDKEYPVRAVLKVTAYEKEDVITSQLELINDGDAPVEVLNRDAAFVALPHSDQAYLTSFYGEWAHEMTGIQEDRVPNGVLKHQHRGVIRTAWPDWPGCFLSLNGPAQEEAGEVFAAALAWSGSWQYKVSKIPVVFRLQSGIFFSAGAQEDPVRLAPKESYVSPEVVMTWSDHGKGQASRNFHKYMERAGLYNPDAVRRIVLNSWEGVYFDFDEEKIIAMMDGAADLGVEMFVLDDGWFANGEFARDGDTAGLGDWQINVRKLPNGLNKLIDAAEARNLEFGLWVEPEMVNPKSRLFEEHPDWAMEVPNRERLTARNQYVLDLSKPEVEEFIYRTVSGILDEYPRIHYIKWDHNCIGLNAGSATLGDNQGALSDLHTEAYYRIMRKLRHNYPAVTFQLCASGGGRADFGAVRNNEEFWASDETNGIKRIIIQWGWSHFYPSKAIASHIGRYGEGDFKLRADVSMTGRLGVELTPSAISEENRAVVRQGIAAYKKLRGVLHRAELFRGRSPHVSMETELTFVLPDKSEAVFFAFQRGNEAQRVKMKMSGLDPEAQYVVTEANPDVEPRFVPGTFSGRELMENGLEIAFPAKPASAVAHLIRR